MNHIKAQFFSRSGLFVCQFLLAILVNANLQLLAENPPISKKAEVESIEARRPFYAREFGKVAYLPSVSTKESAKSAGTFWALKQGGIYTIKPQRQPCWFQFNHKLPGSNNKRRHVGVLLITINTTGATRTVEAYRNEKWYRPGNSKELGAFFNTKSLSWDKFNAMIKDSVIDNADVEAMDATLGGPWHAVPEGGDGYSWEYRKFWSWAVNEFNRELPAAVKISPSTNFRVSARLLGFRPTQKAESENPVIFDSQHRSEDIIFLATYSLLDSGQDIRSWSWIKIK